ncbi:hypothetical protein N7486_010029 [Penicillium sp. IBT 16267x]|nr:hypothetical protein N7486_010029 [Penicillium sp. IBT 16267x]
MSGSSSIPFSSSVRSSTPLIRPPTTSSVPISSSSLIPSGSSFILFSSSSSSSSSSSFSASVSVSVSASSARPSASGQSSSGQSASGPSPDTSATSSGSSLLTQSSEEIGGSTPSTSTYTVTTTQVQTVTSCAATITDCPANQQTTYLTTETITYVTTFCPEADQTTVQPVTAMGSTPLPPTVVIQTSNAQQASTQTDSASRAQITETGMPSSQFTTSTAYVTEIEVVTACPPSVHDCPVGQKGTYTTTKTVAAYMTTYLVAATDSAQASQFTSPVVHPVVVPNLPLAHSHTPSPIPSSDNANYTLPHALSSSLWKAGPASSGLTQAMHATTINPVAGKSTSSVTTTAPGSLFTGDAPKMGQLSTLFTVVAVLSSLLFNY